MTTEDGSREDRGLPLPFSKERAAELLAQGDRLREDGDLALALCRYEQSLAHDYGSARARALVADLSARLSTKSSAHHRTVSVSPDRLGAAATRFRILREIGRGGMGAVYLAEDIKLGRRVALKIFHRSGTRSSSRMSRMLDEARIASTICHPGIVRILDLDPRSGLIVMELLNGASLRDRMRRAEALNPPEVRMLAGSLASVLDVMHARGLIHGDLKPANVLFRDGGREALAEPVLADFGLAHIVHPSDVARQCRLEATPVTGRRPSGTLAFMSPERRRGFAPSVFSDLWALGVILFEAATGRLPFETEALLSSAPVRPMPLPYDIPEVLRLLVENMLDPSPGRRPRSAGEVITRLGTER